MPRDFLSKTMLTEARPSVLIVGEENGDAELTRIQLQTIGLSVVGRASDSRQAVELVGQLRPAVVVIDLALPETEGVHPAAAIYNGFQIPVIVLSDRHGPECLAKASAVGASAVVIKPARAEELERAITLAVARHVELMALRRENAGLRRALAATQSLKGIVPICCGCKKIRDDKGEWIEMEAYFEERTELSFSHGFCDHCLAKYFTEFICHDTA